MIENIFLICKGVGTYASAALGGLLFLYAFAGQFQRVKALSTPRFCQGKNVILTGATGGLGKALAAQLSKNGVRNLVLSGRDETSLALIADECKKATESMNVHIIPCDLSDLTAVEKLASSTLEICNIDIFIHCGGISSRSSFLDTNINVDKTIMTINFFSGALLAKKFVPGMMQRKSGRVIWISSVQGLCKFSKTISEDFFSREFVLIMNLIIILMRSWDALQNKLCRIKICCPRLLRSSSEVRWTLIFVDDLIMSQRVMIVELIDCINITCHASFL